MGSKTSIGWTESTWTPIRARDTATGKVGWHCEHVSEGCRNCYAEAQINKVYGTGLDFKPGNRSKVEIFLDEKMLLAPLRWKKPRMVFVCSMTDLFADFVADKWIDRMFAVMALCPQHTFQVLTKRPGRLGAWYATARVRAPGFNELVHDVAYRAGGARGAQLSKWAITHHRPWPLPNVWLGVSAEDQATADERIPILLDTPAAIRWVSAEPLLGPIDLRQWQHNYGCGCGWGGDSPLDYCPDCGWRGHADGEIGIAKCPDCGRLIDDHQACPECDGHDGDGMSFGPNSRPQLDWVVVGGESGRLARPMHPDWARSLRDQCTDAGVPFFFKQWGEWLPVYDRDRDDPDWRRSDEIRRETPRGCWWNIAGGQGFHGDRVVRMNHVGKKAAGNLLDGQRYEEWPRPAAREAA